jgi:hypothetical protein
MTCTARSRNHLVLAAVLLALTFVTGCHKKEAEAPAPAAAPPPAATPAPTPPPPQAGVTVTGVTLGNAIGADKKISAPSESFAKKDTIYASVATAGTAASATLTARWTYEGKTGSKPVKEDSQTIAPTGDATTEFHISKPDGWPTGDYTVEILLDGKSVAKKSFKVS